MTSPESRQGSTALFFLIAASLLLVNAWQLRTFMVDDAFISFRYARNIAAGQGPVFNPGEHVEGYSNPFYTFLLALVTKGLRSPDFLPAAARFVGILASLGSLFFLSRYPAGWATGLALVLTATSASFSLWAVAGLETPVYGCLITAGALATLARPKKPAYQVLTGLLLSGIILSRPEGILIAGALLLVRIFDPETRNDWAGHARVGVAMATPALLYLVFRFTYFHDVLPNTWYAKKLPLAEAMQKGRWYIVQFIHENGGRWLYLAAPFALLTRETRRAVLVTMFVLAAYIPYILLVGGDWMDQHRFLAPVLPLVYYLVGSGIFAIVDPAVAALKRWPGGPVMDILNPAVLVLVWLLLFLPTRSLIARQQREPYVNGDPYYSTMGRLVGEVIPETWSVATHDIGAIGWFGKARLVDLLGLVDRDLARGKVTGDELIARERPEIVIAHYDNRTNAPGRWRLPDAPGYVTLANVPGSFLVRSDAVPQVEARFQTISDDLRIRLAALDVYLRDRQPDGRSVTP